MARPLNSPAVASLAACRTVTGPLIRGSGPANAAPAHAFPAHTPYKVGVLPSASQSADCWSPAS